MFLWFTIHIVTSIVSNTLEPFNFNKIKVETDANNTPRFFQVLLYLAPLSQRQPDR